MTYKKDRACLAVYKFSKGVIHSEIQMDGGVEKKKRGQRDSLELQNKSAKAWLGVLLRGC